VHVRNLFFGDPNALGIAEERHRMLWILEKLPLGKAPSIGASTLKRGTVQPPKLEV
jgi:hypothetical protein